MAPVTKDQFEAAITKAVKYRTTPYTHCASLSIYWEDNDVSSEEDILDFQHILGALNVSPAEEFMVRSTDQTPGWTLREKVKAIFTSAKNTPGRSLVLLHYTGHAYTLNGSLWAQQNNRPRSAKLSLDRHLLCVSDEQESLLSETDAVDVVYILDCCYVHKALKTVSQDPRIVEIIAATDTDSPMALVHPRNTLTGKLRGEIARRKRDGHKFVEIADLIQTIRSNSPVVKPSHGLHKGVGSVCLPLTGVAQIDPKTLSPSLKAVFSIHIAENMTPHQLEQFIVWIESLPPAFQMCLDGVYHTQSTTLLLCGPWSVYAKLRGLGDIRLAAEVSSFNLAPQLFSQAPSTSRRGLLKENIPFSKDERIPK